MTTAMGSYTHLWKYAAIIATIKLKHYPEAHMSGMDSDQISGWANGDSEVADTARFFAQRRARADFKAFDRLMRRKGGEAPRDGDNIK